MTQCRFCRHSRVKGRETRYCPLDLFAQKEHRMNRAISRLWEDWVASEGQTNNFRVFVDGASVKVSLSLLVSAPSGLICGAEHSLKRLSVSSTSCKSTQD